MNYSQIIILTVFLTFKHCNTIQVDPEVAPLVHGDFPWVLKLIHYYHKDGRTHRYVCGASLISSKFALTAAHCVPDLMWTSSTILYAGDHDIDQELWPLQGPKKSEEQYNKIIEVCDKFIHPRQDIAILKFCKPIKLNNEIQPISLKPPKCNKNFQSKEEKSHDKIYMAGRTDLKSSTLINVVDLSNLEFENGFANREFIAYLISNKSGEITQKGDSGYPLWRTDQECNHIYQIGVYYGYYGSHWLLDGYKVFTNVTKFHDWIINTMVISEWSEVLPSDGYQIFTNVTTFQDWVINTMVISEWSEVFSYYEFFMNFRSTLADLACLVYFSQDIQDIILSHDKNSILIRNLNSNEICFCSDDFVRSYQMVRS